MALLKRISVSQQLNFYQKFDTSHFSNVKHRFVQEVNVRNFQSAYNGEFFGGYDYPYKLYSTINRLAHFP